jgi:hypothetical protein
MSEHELCLFQPVDPEIDSEYALGFETGRLWGKRVIDAKKLDAAQGRNGTFFSAVQAERITALDRFLDEHMRSMEWAEGDEQEECLLDMFRPDTARLLAEALGAVLDDPDDKAPHPIFSFLLPFTEQFIYGFVNGIAGTIRQSEEAPESETP